ncbi:MAG TPA: C45 family peptidase [Sandaracinaceae bacterium LLY-WYZ-13_1]|nr:C45 family peptidase [Sandaracinaceae bacterium LLY-WYZ-13_1]
MDVLSLPAGASATERGRIHGEHFRAKIHAIAQLRLELALSQGKFASSMEVVETARLHLPVLEAFDRDLHAELLGIADGADLDPAKVVILNHYTDLKDVDPQRLTPSPGGEPSGNEDEDCSAVVAGTPEGPVLAQTWDMHGSAEDYVCMLEVPSEHGRPAVWSFTITGCLALAGLNDAGLGVTINNLKSTDARVGVVWPALVRRMLREREAEAAKHVLMTAPMSSGHHYLFATADRAYGVETSGVLKSVVFDARFDDETRAAFVHTNHCLDESVAAVSWVADWSTSYDRYDWLDTSLSARPLEGKHDLWERLGTHDGYPRSVCSHMATAEEPHAMKTCGAILMDLAGREAWVHQGCLNGVEPTTHRFG